MLHIRGAGVVLDHVIVNLSPIDPPPLPPFHPSHAQEELPL